MQDGHQASIQHRRKHRTRPEECWAIKAAASLPRKVSMGGSGIRTRLRPGMTLIRRKASEMKEKIRRTVACAAAGRVNGKFASSIYSYELGAHSHMSKSYDYEAGEHISGAESGNMYHYGAGAHINLTVNGKNFTGYDYDSGSHFQGTVSGHRVSLYDYGDGRYFDYQV